MIQQLTIIGVGLIGGSLARVLRDKGYCRSVVGCSRNVEHLQKAVDIGVIDRFTTDIAEAVRGADMVLLAVPLGAMENCMRAMVGSLADDAVITDAGSAKTSVVAAAKAAFGELPSGFVPGHPIAGNEQSGVEASMGDLYQNRRVILTPLATSSNEAVAKVREMWEQTGALVDEMAVDHHDQILAATSHLPHVLAYSLVHTLLQTDEAEDIFRFAAGGFRDFSRIASSDPVMWRDVCIANRVAIVDVIERYQQDLEYLKTSIETSDSAALESLFETAKLARDRCVKQLQK